MLQMELNAWHYVQQTRIKIWACTVRAISLYLQYGYYKDNEMFFYI
jgi:hypothetical protein